MKIYNSDVKSICVEYGGNRYLLNPCRSMDINEESVCLKLSHLVSDKFNVFWYILNELFTLEQMRTVLVVDGEYIFEKIEPNSTVKIKSHEYVFDKNISYDTFVFAMENEKVIRKKLWIANAYKINKKAKWLYLFGGIKSFLPLSCIALVASVIKLLISNYTEPWFIIMILSLSVIAMTLFLNYKKSLKFLSDSMKQDIIMQYMMSPRKQYRKFSDDLCQKHLDKNSDEEKFW